MVRPVNGMSRVTPPTTTKTCRAMLKDRPGGQQLAEGVAYPDRGAQAALHDDAVDDEQRHEAGEAELLTDRGDDEVGVRKGHDVGSTLTETLAEDAAGAHAVEALHQLVAAADRVVVVRHRVQPDVYTLPDMSEQGPGHERARHEKHQADEQPREPLGGDVQQGHEGAEEKQRCAQVPLEDQHGKAGRPGNNDRPQVSAARQVDAGHPAASQSEDVTFDH